MVSLSRRAFVVGGASVAGGLCLALRLPALAAKEQEEQREPAFVPNAFVRVAPDGAVTLSLHKSEMGQGTHTGLAAILADELDVDVAAVRLKMADEDPAYYLDMGSMGTGGSTSVRYSWDALAQAGATARAMLIAAAARTWKLDPVDCRTTPGRVLGHGQGIVAVHNWGPRFTSRAEARAYQMLGGDVINQSIGPEASAIREIGACFASHSYVVCWEDGIVDMPDFDIDPIHRELAFAATRISLATMAAVAPDDDCGCARLRIERADAYAAFAPGRG